MRVREVIVVEGRYDKNTLRQAVDALVIETGGFGVFNDAEKRELLRTLARERGVILLTDSDGAGFVIRNFLKGCIPPEYVKNAYIPDVYGKEKRKSSPSKEGKLGVEGMRPEVIIEALRRAGATFEQEDGPAGTERITKADLYSLGLTGRPDSAQRRRELQKKLGLPERLSTNALLEVLGAVTTLEQLRETLTSDGPAETPGR